MTTPTSERQLDRPLRILSLGAGVQSSTVLMMSIRGELPKLDHTIFADTGWEPKAVYRHLWWLAEQATAAGIPLHIVGRGTIRSDTLNYQVRGGKKRVGERWGAMPMFLRNRKTGKHGIVKRKCTKEYKIQPVEKYLGKLAGLRPRQRAPKGVVLVEQWYGISADEASRMRMADKAWIVNRYPLIYDVRMKRQGCLDWMLAHGYPKPPRSACIGCPFHSNHEWRRLRDDSPEEFADAVEVDAAIRVINGMRGEAFLHSQRVPLDQVDLSTAEERGQLSMFDDECLGVCGV